MIPTVIPSTRPSFHFSVYPSLIPSINPSVKQTVKPSIGPSINTSSKPSINTSSKPSINTSSKPSINPTNHPSIPSTRLPTIIQPLLSSSLLDTSIPNQHSFTTTSQPVVAGGISLAPSINIGISPIITYNPASPPIVYNSKLSNLISNSSHPICESLYGNKPIISSTNICKAYNIVKIAFIKLLPSSTDILLRGKLFGKVVRLAFHDAGEYDIRTSDLLGPDGCLSEKSDNAGLIEPESLVLTILEPIWQQVCGYISRADYWIMFAILVLNEATNQKISINYQYGRKDNLECDPNHSRLPSGQSGMIDIEKVFTKQMGLTITDAGKYKYIFIYSHY